MNHNKSWGIVFAVKGNCVDKPRFIAGGPEPPDFRPRGPRPYINLFLHIGGSEIHPRTEQKQAMNWDTEIKNWILAQSINFTGIPNLIFNQITRKL